MRVFVYSAVSILCLAGLALLAMIAAGCLIVAAAAVRVERHCHRPMRRLEAAGRGYLKLVEELECRTATRSRPTVLSSSQTASTR